ncbi:MAG: hypothetical protein WBY47_08285 [Desulfobacterales bacterium]|jgi:hypothetical protein
MPRFNYFLSNTKNPVQEKDRIWSTPVPLSRTQSAGTFESNSDMLIHHGGCFLAARDFLKRDRYAIITQAVSQHLGRRVSFNEIEEIRIILDKHGAFYHPAKIEAVMKDVRVPFVLNIAVTGIGKECAQREYRILKMLNTDASFSFIPDVYALGSVITKTDHVEARMFLAEWFEGFNEFHLSHDPSDGMVKMVVWDNKRGNFFLTGHQTMHLYREIAKILTYYYNIETFEQIFSWHHAAGDFVLKCRKEDVEVKLVTVRHYRSMFEQNFHHEKKTMDAEIVLEALLVFFFNMAIKIRIDRLDGIGEIAWSDKIALKGMLKGFFEGLALKLPAQMFQAPLVNCFRQHLLACSPADFSELNHAIVRGYPLQAPEVPVIRRHLESHIEDLYNASRQLEKV